MKRLRPRTTIIGGAAIGLIAGVAVYGAFSTAAATLAPVSVSPAVVKVAPAPAGHSTLADCAPGAKLEDGICVVHVRKVVVLPAPAVLRAQAPTGGQAQSRSASAGRTSHGSGWLSSGSQAASSGSQAASATPVAAVSGHREGEAEHATGTVRSASDSADTEP